MKNYDLLKEKNSQKLKRLLKVTYLSNIVEISESLTPKTRIAANNADESPT